MAFIALVVSLLVAALGALGIFSPARLVGVIRRFQTPTGLYVAAGIRLVFGVALFVCAPGSRAPEALRALGVVIIVAGLITPFFGLERFRKGLELWLAMGPLFLRAWGALALVFGLLLAYAVVP